MRPIIYPYKMGSGSAKRLCQELKAFRAKRVRPDGKYKPFRNHLIINWGNSAGPVWTNGKGRWLNIPPNVAIASNKLWAFKAMKRAGVSIPEFTTDVGEVRSSEEGTVWVCRKKLTGHSGEGIELYAVEEAMEIPYAPLYVKYMKKKHEYRVHVFNGKVIDVQWKRKRVEQEEVNYQIRNHSNGWVYCREGLEIPNGINKLAIDSVNALGLDFGAVDIIHNVKQDMLYVLEVNTAPGLFETTLQKYVNAIKEML